MAQTAAPQRAHIEWSDELSVGIQEIDEQHKVLVGLVNDMHRAIHEHHGRDTARAILEKLGDYTRVHFAVEESLMRIFEASPAPRRTRGSSTSSTSASWRRRRRSRRSSPA